MASQAKETSLLLGTAAGFAAIAGAQAADLPGKAAPAEYVRICDTYGAGFFFIPGTDTCLRIGGFVRIDYNVNSAAGTGNQPTTVVGGPGTGNILGNLPVQAFDSNYGTNVRGTLNFDARSNTEYGLLRSFTQFSVYRAAVAGGISSQGQINSGVNTSARQSNIGLERAFIQFAGFTFGFSASFFNFFQGDVSMGRPYAATATSTSLLAYTASFGSGFSATVSVEDGYYRRMGNGDVFAGSVNLALGAAATNQGVIGTGLVRPLSGAYGMTYAGQQIPDIVANLRVDQGWGSAQLMGALHQIRDYGSCLANCGAISGVSYPLQLPGGGLPPSVQRAGDKFGWALGAGLRLNLDMLARGDVLWLQAVYSDGATDYAFSTANQGGDRQTISGAANLAQTNSLTAQIRDAVIVNNAIQTVKVMSLSAGFRHFWTPNVRSAIFGAYSDINAPVASTIPDVKYWQVGVNTFWSPVRNLDLGLEVVYHNINARQQNGTALPASGPNGVNATVGRTVEGAWVGTFRAQRNF